MTTLGSQADKTLCHPDKLSNTEVAEIPSDCGSPVGTSPLESQVAGHPSDDKGNTIGYFRKRINEIKMADVRRNYFGHKHGGKMMSVSLHIVTYILYRKDCMLRRSDGRIFKPVVKPLLGQREIAFYESLQVTQDPVLLQLRNYVPRYYGTTELPVYGRRVTFLTLKDITDGMAEPCVMDIKIGRRTWDPLATPQKRATEELKYAESKRTYGFCITGFQVHCLSSGQLRKFGKHYGKTLDAKGVVEALKIFLNISPERPPCRQLIVKLLSFLWKILLFFRTQRLFRFYSSSLLVAYDVKRLRDCLRLNDTGNDRSTSTVAKSVSSTNSHATQAPSNVFKDVNDVTSNSVSASVGTIRNRTMERVHFVKRSISLSCECESSEREKTLNRSGSCSPDFRVDRLCRTHSCVNNKDDDIIRMEEDYDVLLNELSSSSEDKQNWVRMNMIDFTHVFPAEDQSTLDLNYMEGIENLIKLVEMFLVSKDNTA